MLLRMDTSLWAHQVLLLDVSRVPQECHSESDLVPHYNPVLLRKSRIGNALEQPDKNQLPRLSNIHVWRRRGDLMKGC
jgi:hypothetical protein